MAFVVLLIDKKRYGDGPAPFDFKSDDTCGHEWKKWLRGYEIYARANSMNEPEEKLNWMLHYAGSEVQTIFDTLPSTGGEEEQQSGPYSSGYVFKRDVYANAIEKLNAFFEPKQNVSYERHIYRQIQQKKDERFDMFVIRLREQADRCNFGDELDGNIREQITTGCYSDILRGRILEKNHLDLNQIIRMAQISEMVLKQKERFERGTPQQSERGTPQQSEPLANGTKIESVCKIENKQKFVSRKRFGGFDGFCGRCGSKGHKSADEKCPARGKSCNLCGRKDHFARRCFARESGGQSNGFLKRKADTRDIDQPIGKVKREEVQLVQSGIETGNSQTDFASEYEDIFCMMSESDKNKLWCVIGRIDAVVVVDSGSRYNVVDRESWAELKAKGIVTMKRQKEVKFNG